MRRARSVRTASAASSSSWRAAASSGVGWSRPSSFLIGLKSVKIRASAKPEDTSSSSVAGVVGQDDVADPLEDVAALDDLLYVPKMLPGESDELVLVVGEGFRQALPQSLAVSCDVTFPRVQDLYDVEVQGIEQIFRAGPEAILVPLACQGDTRLPEDF